MTATPGNPKGTEAQLDPVGIGGWLLLPAIGLVVSPIVSAFIVVFNVHFVLSAGFTIIILLATIVEIALLVWTIQIARLFFRKDPDAPDSFITLVVVRFVLAGVLVFLAWFYYGVSLTVMDLTNVIAYGLACIIWISYFRCSVRVRNTFWGGFNSFARTERPRRSPEEILSNQKCPTCGSRLRRAQVDLMIGKAKYQPWCRGGYCSLVCFQRGSGGRRVRK